MIYVTGDLHGNYKRLSSIKLKKTDSLIVCGDFGFIWDGSKKEKDILSKIGKRKFNILFVDGAHENHELLNKYPVSEWNGGETRQISGNLRYLMRGQLFDIEGKKIFTFGGGEYSDLDYRDTDKWNGLEMPTKEELDCGVENLEKAHNKVDYFISHEPPKKIKSLIRLSSNVVCDTTNVINTYLDEASRVCEYKRWYFGSLHIDKNISPKNIAVFKRVLPVENTKKVHIY